MWASKRLKASAQVHSWIFCKRAGFVVNEKKSNWVRRIVRLGFNTHSEDFKYFIQQAKLTIFNSIIDMSSIVQRWLTSHDLAKFVGRAVGIDRVGLPHVRVLAGTCSVGYLRCDFWRDIPRCFRSVDIWGAPSSALQWFTDASDL